MCTVRVVCVRLATVRGFLSHQPGALAAWPAGQTLGAMVLLFTYPRAARSSPASASLDHEGLAIQRATCQG